MTQAPKQTPKQVKRGPRCPSCNAYLADDLSPTAPFRPFCSERCKLIDLGKWLGGAHAIAGEPAFIDDDDEN